MEKKVMLLGMYNNPLFREKSNIKNYFIFDDFMCEIEKNTYPLHEFNQKVIEFGIETCEEIVFLLDNITTPLNSEVSYTCLELVTIFNNKNYLDKTTFLLNNKIMPVKKVKEKYYILN